MKSPLPWLLLVLCLILVSAYHGTVLPVLVTMLTELFVVTAASVGLLLASSSIGTMAASAVAGPLIDYLGERPVLVGAMIGIALFLFLAAIAPGIGIYFLASIGIAMTHNAINMAVPLFIISLYPAWKRKSFALNLVTGIIPGLFFPLLIERLIVAESVAPTTVFRLPYALVASLCFILAAAFLLRMPRATKAVRRELSFFSAVRRRMAPVLRSRRTWLYVALLVLHSTGDAVIYQWFPTYLTTRFTSPAIGPGSTLSLFSLSYFLSRLLIVILPDERGRRFFVVVPGLAGGALMIASLLTTNSAAASILYAAAAFFWSFEFPAMFSEAYRESGAGFGSFQSVAFLVSSLSGFLVISGIGLATGAGVSLGALLAAVASCFIGFSVLAFFSGVGKPTT